MVQLLTQGVVEQWTGRQRTINPHFLVILDGEAEIPNLAPPLLVQKDIVWLYVKVQDVISVQEFQTLQEHD